MATIETDRPGTVQGEVRMLIDGELVEAASGKRFDNINPATEEVLGEVADASADDMQRAIAAARRAFDETDWSTNHAFRKKCLRAAAGSDRERAGGAAPRARRRGRLPDRAHLRPAARRAARRRAAVAGGVHRPLRVGARAPRRHTRSAAHSKRWVVREAAGVVGAIVPWNFPFEVSSQKIGQALATGNTVILKPAPDTPWNATRLGRLVAEKTDIPAGVFNVVTSSDHLVGEELTDQPARRPHLVHRFDRHRQAHLREGRRHDEAPLPRAGRQVGRHRARRRRPRGEDGHGVHGVRARRPGLRDGRPGCSSTARSTTRRSRSRRPASRTSPTATPPTSATSWARSSAPSSATACSATSRRARKKARGSSPAAVGPSSSTRAGSCSRRSSPTSTTT